MGLSFLHGSVLMVDHTPGSAVSAGDIVQVNGKACIAHSDIPAGRLGAVAYPSGTGVYTLDVGTVFNGSEEAVSAGAQLYVESGGDLSNAATDNIAVGAMLDASAEATIATAGKRVVHGG